MKVRYSPRAKTSPSCIFATDCGSQLMQTKFSDGHDDAKVHLNVKNCESFCGFGCRLRHRCGLGSRSDRTRVIQHTRQKRRNGDDGRLRHWAHRCIPRLDRRARLAPPRWKTVDAPKRLRRCSQPLNAAAAPHRMPNPDRPECCARPGASPRLFHSSAHSSGRSRCRLRCSKLPQFHLQRR